MWVLKWTPFLARTSSASETRNELTIATTSHQALTRHQNQRTQVEQPGAGADLEDDVEGVLGRCRAGTPVADDSRNSRTVARRPTST